jgi:hypothetical protein
VTDKPAATQDQLKDAVERLNPEEAAFFLAKLEASLRKRKLQLTGYLVALVMWLACMLLALAYYGSSDGFVGWAFLVPFGVFGLVVYVFGKWADRVGGANDSPAAPTKR